MARKTTSKWIAGIGLCVGALMTSTVAHAEPITIGIDAAYRPYAFVEANGELAGFEVEIVELLCAEMEADCNIINVPWDGIFASLETGGIDLIGTGITLTDSNRASYTMSDPFYQSGLAFIVVEEDEAGSIEDLRGKVIGTVVGVPPWEAYAQHVLGEDVEIRGYDSIDAAVLDMDAGRIDVVMSDNLQLQDAFVSTGRYKFVGDVAYGPEWTGDGKALVFRKDAPEALVERFNAAIEAIVANGSHAEVGVKYFDAPVPVK